MRSVRPKNKRFIIRINWIRKNVEIASLIFMIKYKEDSSMVLFLNDPYPVVATCSVNRFEILALVCGFSVQT